MWLNINKKLQGLQGTKLSKGNCRRVDYIPLIFTAIASTSSGEGESEFNKSASSEEGKKVKNSNFSKCMFIIKDKYKRIEIQST